MSRCREPSGTPGPPRLGGPPLPTARWPRGKGPHGAPHADPARPARGVLPRAALGRGRGRRRHAGGRRHLLPPPHPHLANRLVDPEPRGHAVRIATVARLAVLAMARRRLRRT